MLRQNLIYIVKTSKDLLECARSPFVEEVLVQEGAKFIEPLAVTEVAVASSVPRDDADTANVPAAAPAMLDRWLCQWELSGRSPP